MSASIASSTTSAPNRRARRRQRHRNRPHSAGAVTNINRSWETDSEEDRKIVMKRASSVDANGMSNYHLAHPFSITSPHIEKAPRGCTIG